MSTQPFCTICYLRTQTGLWLCDHRFILPTINYDRTLLRFSSDGSCNFNKLNPLSSKSVALIFSRATTASGQWTGPLVRMSAHISCIHSMFLMSCGPSSHLKRSKCQYAHLLAMVHHLLDKADNLWVPLLHQCPSVIGRQVW